MYLVAPTGLSGEAAGALAPTGETGDHFQPISRRPNTVPMRRDTGSFDLSAEGSGGLNRVDQVWAADITYIPMAKGFLYLVAIMDWRSRHVLAWKLSNTMDTSFCVAALEEALGKGRPEIFNTDQGSQFTSEAFTQTLQEQRVQVRHGW